MSRLQSSINTASADFRRNEAHNRRLVAEFRAKHEAARHSRPQRDLDRLARQQKMPQRKRIEMLLDPGTPFLELSSLAANMAYGGANDIKPAGSAGFSVRLLERFVRDFQPVAKEKGTGGF